MKSLFQRIRSRLSSEKSSPPPYTTDETLAASTPKTRPALEMQAPTLAEWQEAKSALELAARPASLGQLGGFRPDDVTNRFTSWWGGNFLGALGESIPRCEETKAEMLPIFQLRVDELPSIPKALEGVKLLTLWFDVHTKHVWDARNGKGFVIRTYPSLKGLQPLGPGYREHATMPTFPIRWHNLEQDLPDWSDFVDTIPTAVARAPDSEWFFGHPGNASRANLQQDKPLKIGGYSQWWQEPQDVGEGEFVFLLDSTPRGQFGLPAGGSANFFKEGNSWRMLADNS
ncbi:hypothetical protein [Roseovarius sp.]|uniref:hypothetical protein n=1 Tax=Roseovarius sp. TaxID=1486281 RepID=UPI0025803556|nr:hypothetical protein [Roseovarius sp.]